MPRSHIHLLVAVFFSTVAVFALQKRKELEISLFASIPEQTAAAPTIRAVAATATPAASQAASPAPTIIVPVETQRTMDAFSSMPFSDTAEVDAKEARLQKLSMDVLSSRDAETRAEAIQQLNGVRTADVMYALGEAALRDQEKPIRYMAVESLRLLAANQGDQDGNLRAILRQAMNDSDAEVARHAREAYNDVAEMLGQP